MQLRKLSCGSLGRTDPTEWDLAVQWVWIYQNGSVLAMKVVVGRQRISTERELLINLHLWFINLNWLIGLKLSAKITWF